MSRKPSVSASGARIHEAPQEASLNRRPTSDAATVAEVLPAAASPVLSVSASPIAANEGRKSLNGGNGTSSMIIGDDSETKVDVSTKISPLEPKWNSPENLREIGLSSAMILGGVFPLFTALLMGLYYLEAKYGQDMVTAFAVIWVVFVVVGIIGIYYAYTVRMKDEKILLAQQAAEEEEKQAKLTAAAQARFDEAELKKQASIAAQ